MKYQPQPITISFETVTPIFIGSGAEIKPLSFVVDGQQVCLLDEGRFFAGLLEEARQLYLAWIDPLITQIEQLETRISQARRARNENERRQLQQELRRQEDRLSLEHFIKERMPGVPPARLVQRIGCVTYQVEAPLRLDRNGFRACLKDVQHRPYMPGTEIKGALRTALLSDMLAVPQNYQALRQAVAQFQPAVQGHRPNRGRVRREIPKISRQVEKQLLRGSKDDAKFDLLRMVRLSDSRPLTPADLRLEQTKSVGTRRFTDTVLETMKQDVSGEFQLEVVEDQPAWLQQLGLSGKAHWLTTTRLLQACYHRARLTLQVEQTYFDQQGERALALRAAQLLALNRPEQPLLRIGGGQGFLSITGDGWLEAQDPDLYEVIRKGVSLQRNWRTTANNFPKTRRVIRREGQFVEMLGWIRLIPPADVQEKLTTVTDEPVSEPPQVLDQPPQRRQPIETRASSQRQTGRVKWFNEGKRYGFIEPDDGGADLFVYISQVASPPLRDGQRVTFTIGQGKKGLEAQDVRPEA